MKNYLIQLDKCLPGGRVHYIVPVDLTSCENCGLKQYISTRSFFLLKTRTSITHFIIGYNNHNLNIGCDD